MLFNPLLFIPLHAFYNFKKQRRLHKLLLPSVPYAHTQRFWDLFNEIIVYSHSSPVSIVSDGPTTIEYVYRESAIRVDTSH